MFDFLYRQPVMSGIVLGMTLGLPHFLFNADVSSAIAGLTLALIAGVYIGFAISEKREMVIVHETAVATMFTLAAFGALFVSPWITPAALTAHGVWDLLHEHDRESLANPPSWYPRFCCATDLSLAAAISASLAL